MSALAALAAPRAQPGVPPQQFVSLRSFFPQARPQARRRRSCRPPPAAAAAEELLLGARPLVLPAVPIPEADQLPPFQEWHKHPELLTGCEPGAAPLQVAVLLSGGVDSSLALHLLKAAGHQVTAFYLQIWFQEDFRNFWDACPWEEDLAYCQAVCERLGVELRMVPLTEQYWDRVVAHCIAEIRQGRTPNPDVLCNSRVKFGAFYEYLEQEHGAAFDRVASGHYARLERSPTPGPAEAAAAAEAAGERGPQPAPLAQQQQQQQHGGEQQDVRLALTPDAVKDQTYFLAHLSQRQLARTLFPLGHLTKPQVRALAEAADLPNKARKDSQGICFLGKVKFSEFVREHLGEWPGPIVEEETEEVVGYHRGFWFHTVGQRKGIPLSGGPWYVTRKDPSKNAVFVSRQYHEHAHRRDAFTCGPISWCSAARPDPVRHGPHMYGCQLEGSDSSESSELRVTLDGNDQGLAAGQFAVFYQGGVCLGSAVISGCDAY
ncbi:hypothetical protein COHA_002977 [Chlorella ohadii]|uniref:tRNA-5-taurinomethyluridine 2-sulfurtransferase n=1 Tax=Chlorella ohadii TaxID=2649997 RepID=A0AAD5H3X4_9CHLO|nr:hypothetical protein COHA_002977 [Chlorella ohadii]